MKKLNISNYPAMPTWLNEEGLKTLNGGYLLAGETPKDMHLRLAYTAAKILKREDLQQDFFDIFYNGWLGPSTPVAANFGTDKGLSISCYLLHIADTIESIYGHLKEAAKMSKRGGGVGALFSDIRGSGTAISGGGVSTGVIPWIKQYDYAASAVSQGGVRRGAFAYYLDIEHPDALDLLHAKDHLQGDPRNMIDGNIAFVIRDESMEKIRAGDPKLKPVFDKALEMSLKVGSPYFLFLDNVNRQNPEAYNVHNLKVSTSNLCLTGDTLVATKEGALPIKELVGKEVTIFDGENWVKNDKFFYQGKSEVLEVTLANGQVIKMTPDHRCLVQNSYTDIRYRKTRELKAQELKVGTWLVVANDFSTQGYINEKGAYLKGFLIGDGTKSRGNPLLHLYSPKFVCEKMLKQSTLELEEVEVNTNAILDVSFTEAKEYKNPKYFGVSIRKLMKGLSCRKAHLYDYVSKYKTCLPEDILLWDRESRLLFISGLFDADGSSPEGRSLQLSNINENIVKEIANVLFSLGYTPNLDTFYPEASRTMYRISLSSWDYYNLYQEAYFQRLYWKGIKPNRKTSQWRKIISIKQIEDVQDVYCTKVDTTSYFALANGILTGNCSEITLYTDDLHSAICCLSSLNLAKWFEWKDWVGTSGKTVPELAVYFLDAVMSSFIKDASKDEDLVNAVRSAVKGRPLGIGSMGEHFLYQMLGIPFKSKRARELNIETHKFIQDMAKKASADMAKELGQPEWCEGTEYRHTHLCAIAPTTSNSVITGAFSPGIEPSDSNTYTKKQAKGSFVRKNPLLIDLLESKGKNTPEIWDSILKKNGSVMHLDCLTFDEKNVFLTAREIDQEELVRQAADRQPYICQAMSLNRFVHPDISPAALSSLVMLAYANGVKSMYYTKSWSPLVLERVKNDAYIITKPDCPYCAKAKELLTEMGANIVEIPRKEVTDFIWKTVPQIWYQGHYIGGYEELLDFKLSGQKREAKDSEGTLEEGVPVIWEEEITGCTSCEG
jgi:ribonucleoside-diphosphate reductase alpha chain